MLSVAFDILLKLLERYLIKILKLPILLPLLLNRIISQMYKFIIQILKRIDLTRRSHIPLLIPIPFNASIHAGYQHVASHIEFAFVVEIWVLDVFLDD